MDRQELRRLWLCGALLAAVPVALAVRLVHLQVAQAASIARPERPDGTRPPELPLDARAAARQYERAWEVPAPRADIVDRDGMPLAVDRPVLEVRAVVTVPYDRRGDPPAVRAFARRLAREVAVCLAGDPEHRDDPDYRADQRRRLEARIARALHLDDLPARGGDGFDPGEKRWERCWHGDFLVHPRLDSLEVIQGLRRLRRAPAWREILRLHERPHHHRAYPYRELTGDIVGVLAPLQPGTERRGRSGLERLTAAAPREAGVLTFALDARQQVYFRADGRAPAEPRTVRTTLDLQLQREAVRLLAQACEGEATAHGNRHGTEPHPPRWGALVLVDVPRGDILALASWLPPDQRGGGTITAYQRAYEPGSVVKPLVFAWAQQREALYWEEIFDCAPTGGPGKNAWRIEGTGRYIHDDHRCGHLKPHGILVNSSNIGAVQVGRRLGREDWLEWLDLYGFGRSLGLHLPHERTGDVTLARQELADPGRFSERYIHRNTVTSLSIGYQVAVTPLQLARAYLTLLSGRRRELRLVDGVGIDGGMLEVPRRDRGSERLLGPPFVERVVAALREVVSDREEATGSRHVWPVVRAAGLPQGVVAGKTGTAESRSGSHEVRNATFVGFGPARAPRYLAVCAIQKEKAAKFYGGRYAGPAAAELLVQALAGAHRTDVGQNGRPGGQAGTGGSRRQGQGGQ